MDKNGNGNGNENSINQQKNIITTSEEEGLMDAMSEAYDYMHINVSDSMKIQRCFDSTIFFKIHVEYMIATTSTILQILNHRFTRFHIYGMRGSEDKDVIFECRVNYGDVKNE